MKNASERWLWRLIALALGVGSAVGGRLELGCAYTLLLAALLLSSCTTEVDAARALHGHGFTDVEAWYVFLSNACSSGEEAYEFRARNARNDWVEGTVCCRYFKGCTVRF